MRHLLAFAAAACIAAPAAAVSFTSAPGAPDPGIPAGHTLVVSFDAPEAAGYSWSAGISTAIGSSSAAAAPAGDTTIYGYVSSASNPNSATLSTPNLRSISFYWGSIDKYNQVEVLGANGVVLDSFNGGDFMPANGNQFISDTNRRVTFGWDGSNAITGLRFTSTGVAFEFDDISALAVPEPATWAMLIAGFGMVGYAVRRRQGARIVSA